MVGMARGGSLLRSKNRSGPVPGAMEDFFFILISPRAENPGGPSEDRAMTFASSKQIGEVNQLRRLHRHFIVPYGTFALHLEPAHYTSPRSVSWAEYP